MSNRGTDYQHLNEALRWEDDGLPRRRVGSWSRDKVAILAYYLPGFAKICRAKSRAGAWYYLDGFAGNGVNDAPGLPLSKGTALVGVSQELAPAKAVLVERDPESTEALRRRVERFPNVDTTVIEGDVNDMARVALGHLSDRGVPGICVLDPEGLELDWLTVQECASHRLRGTPYELLIYFSTPGAARTAGVRAEGHSQRAEQRLTHLFGDETWRIVADEQRAGRLAPGESGAQYVQLYADKIRSLGYEHLQRRAAIREDGGLVYHMIFASSNEAGRKIMTDAFARAFASQIPLQL